MSLRVLLALHHRFTGGDESPAATLALGAALADLGCRVDYFGYEDAFGHDSVDSLRSRLQFPWRLSSYLHQRAADFDVVDISGGDGWVWARHRCRTKLKSPAIIARSDGLGKTPECCGCLEARGGRLKLSWKNTLYYSGYRHWEVRKSLQHCDQAIVGNERDRNFCIEVLGLPPLQVSLMGIGLGSEFLGLEAAVFAPLEQPIRLVVAGEWNEQIGKRCIIRIAAQLHAGNVPFSLTLLNTVRDEVEVGTDFPVEIRSHLRVIPQCRFSDFPRILQSHHLLLQCGTADRRVPAMPEMMACGVAPISGNEFDTARIIVSAVNGELAADPTAFTAIIKRWAGDRQALQNIRLCAQKTAKRHEWHSIASQTIIIYETALTRSLGAKAPRLVGDELTAADNSIVQRPIRPTLSVCICTADRPKVLRRCLASIEQGEMLPTEVVVADDTLDGTETAAVCGDFAFVRYVRGPRRGLCANRNVVIAAATSDFIALLDDDSEVTPQFVRLALDVTANSDRRTIFTGDVLEGGVDRIPPSNPTFWGHFGKPLAVMGQCETVHLNSNIFPRSAFSHARFDERIVYGYEQMDICQQMLVTGHRIEYRRELVNLHLPPPRSAEVLKSQDEQAIRARYYTSLKRYMLWQSRPLRAFAYAALAPLHQAAHHLIHRQLSQALVGFSDMSWAVHQALEFRKAARESSAEVSPPAEEDQKKI